MWLRERRLRLALWIAVAEGVLVAFHVIPWWVALLAAAGLLAVYVAYGRSARAPAVRQASWIAAASQVMVALIPVLVLVIGTLAVIGVAVLAIVALVFLLRDRR